MKMNILSGATLAATAVALALGGTVVSPAAAKERQRSLRRDQLL